MLDIRNGAPGEQHILAFGSGCFVSSSSNAGPQPMFTRQSESESVCRFCSTTIRTDRYTPLDAVEEIHADVCLVKPEISWLEAA